MAWKPKEKPLTLEEATELAKKDLAPFWFGSEPLLAAITTEKRTVVYPLNPKFSSTPWILIFVDPTDFSTESALELAREWNHRYSRYDLNILLCFHLPYQALCRPEFIAQLLKKDPLPFISMLDAKGLVFSAFGAKELPKALLLNQGQVTFEQHGLAKMTLLEASLQSFLRKTDPGLSLPPPLAEPLSKKQDLARIHFADPKLYPAPGFKPGPNGVLIGKFGKSSSSQKAEKSVQIIGTWIKAGERIITSDPNAMITLISPAITVAIMAQATLANDNSAEIEVEINGNPPYEEILAQDLFLAEDGRAIAPVHDPRPYQLLANLPSQEREITLRFPSADQCAVELFGIRLGI